MKTQKTYEEIEQFVFDYIESCGKDSIINLYESITGEEVEGVLEENEVE